MKNNDEQTNGSEAATQEAANAAEEKAARIAQEAITACQTLLAVHVSGIDLPGGARDSVRSEERRVGKEGRSRWSPYH